MAALVALCALAYLPALRAGFVYDDMRFVNENTAIRDLANTPAYFTNPATMTSDFDRDIYRPLRTLAFALQWALVGPRPFLYHLVSLAWHLLAVLLLFRLLHTAARLPAAAAVLGAAIFGLHPLATEAVAWISSQGDLMSAVFFLAALQCAMMGPRAAGISPERLPTNRHRRLRTIALFGLATLSMLSKESGIAIVPAALGALVIVRRDGRRQRTAEGLVLLAAAVAYLVVRGFATGDFTPTQTSPETLALGRRVAWNLRSLLTEMRLLVWPAGLCVDYGEGAIAPPTGLSVLFAGSLLAVLAGLSVRCRSHAPLISLGLLSGFAALVPTSYALFGVKSLVAERFLYIPLAGLAMILASLLARPHRGGIISKIATAIALLVLLLAAQATFGRCLDWHDQESLWRATLRVRPASIDARLALAAIADERGRADSAHQYWQEILARTAPLDPRHLGALFCLSRKQWTAGRVAETRTMLETIHRRVHERFRRLNLGWYREAMILLGDARRRSGDPQAAASLFDELLEEFGPDADLLEGLGISLDLAGRSEEAEKALRAAIPYDPDSATRRVALGTFLNRHGRFDEAIEVFTAALARQADSPRARTGLASARAHRRD